MNKAKFFIIFTILVFYQCIPNLKGKPTSHKPEFTGMYIFSDNSQEKEDILKLKILVIFENSKNELEYYFKNFTRLSFHISDNREEIITRRGFVITSGHELLFRENNMEEEQKLYYGPKQSDPRNWTALNMGPRARVRFIDKEPPSGYDRLAEISSDYKEILIKNEKYQKIGNPFIGTIQLTHGKNRLKLQNDISGTIYYTSKPTGEIAAIVSNPNSLEIGMKVEIATSQGKVIATIEQKSEEMIFLKPEKSVPIQKFDSVSPVGVVDLKTNLKKNVDPEELIRRLKSNKNLSREELIRELEKLKK
ncbi:MAG: hypothetical protein L6Q54_02260 [Leptospiraceae bacterium]|nr:hypothetical protein [Leptospiraceae bacterium]MCK6380062.1 hypothetical protein [Leptospiraceae bacterium]NUM40655.1 hypothetical protein [Leptospiraceae bacterium]